MSLRSMVAFLVSLPPILVMHLWFLLILIFPVLFYLSNPSCRLVMAGMLFWQYVPYPNKARVKLYRLWAESS